MEVFFDSAIAFDWSCRHSSPTGLKLEVSSRKAWLLVGKEPAADRDLCKLNLEVNQRFERYQQHQKAAKSCWTEEPCSILSLKSEALSWGIEFCSSIAAMLLFGLASLSFFAGKGTVWDSSFA